MSLKRTILELYKDVDSGADDKTQSYAPATGEFNIVIEEAEAAFDLNCAVKVMFNGTDIVYETKGSLGRNLTKTRTGDGVKKVELVLDANDLPSGSVLLGGKVVIVEEI